MKKLLTVIVPTYNVEKFIEQNLRSFEIPALLDLLEVIIISDGSRDSSVDIARGYVERYPGTYRIIEKENGGHGSTINRGIQEATGKYFKVVDADDWVLEEGMANLVECLKKVDSDVVVSNFYWYHHVTGKCMTEIKEPFPKVIYGKEYKFDDVCEMMYIKMHAMTIKTEILKQIPSIDEHCFYVDAEYVLFPIPYINTVTCIQNYVYMYRIGLPGQSMDISKMQRNEENFDRVLNRVLHYYENHIENMSKARINYMENFLGRLVASRFKIFLSYPKDKAILQEMRHFDSSIKMNYPRVYAAIRNKSVRMLQISNFLLYPIAQYIYKKREGSK